MVGRVRSVDYISLRPVSAEAPQQGHACTEDRHSRLASLADIYPSAAYCICTGNLENGIASSYWHWDRCGVSGRDGERGRGGKFKRLRDVDSNIDYTVMA